MKYSIPVAGSSRSRPYSARWKAVEAPAIPPLIIGVPESGMVSLEKVSGGQVSGFQVSGHAFRGYARHANSLKPDTSKPDSYGYANRP